MYRQHACLIIQYSTLPNTPFLSPRYERVETPRSTQRSFSTPVLLRCQSVTGNLYFWQRFTTVRSCNATRGSFDNSFGSCFWCDDNDSLLMGVAGQMIKLRACCAQHKSWKVSTISRGHFDIVGSGRLRSAVCVRSRYKRYMQVGESVLAAS